MTVFAGHYGEIELKRLGVGGALPLRIEVSDIDEQRKRVALSTRDGGELTRSTIITGDRVRITTADNRGLPFRFYRDAANTQYIDDPTAGTLPLEFVANVDAMGAIRMYRDFHNAINNSGSNYLAVPLAKALNSAPWDVDVSLLPGVFRRLGKVQGFTLSSDRETTETTSLGDKFKEFSPSAISGSGSVDCLFDFGELTNDETPLAICELIQKIEVGSRFSGKFYLLEPGPPQPPGYQTYDGVWYEVDGIMTKAGITVRADQIVECSFNFISSGQFVLRSGKSGVDLVTEANASIGNEMDLEALGVLQEDN